MKKILFIIILATILIPISQTGAFQSDVDSHKSNTKELQATLKQKSNNELKSESLPAPEKIKKEEKIKKISVKRQRVTKKKISSERRSRLFGLLLLAYGGQK